jgi:hypothetical protein
VGGSVIWATSIIQSLTPPAYAQYALCGCCYCWNGDRQNPSNDGCFDNRATGFPGRCRIVSSMVPERPTESPPSGPFAFSEYCSGSTNLPMQ